LIKQLLKYYGEKKYLPQEENEKLIAVMKSYERKSKLSHYDMWSKQGRSYNFKIKELDFVTAEWPEAYEQDKIALDSGCGYGLYSLMLSDKGYAIVGLDASAGMLKKAKDAVPKGTVFFVRGSITDLPFREGEFDLTLCVDTLHHLTDNFLGKTFDEFRRIIKFHGMLITDIRNALNPAVSLQYWMKRRKWAEKGGLVLKARSLGQMKRKLIENDFKILKTKSIGFFAKLFPPYIVIVSERIKDEKYGKEIGE